MSEYDQFAATTSSNSSPILSPGNGTLVAAEAAVNLDPYLHTSSKRKLSDLATDHNSDDQAEFSCDLNAAVVPEDQVHKADVDPTTDHDPVDDHSQDDDDDEHDDDETPPKRKRNRLNLDDNTICFVDDSYEANLETTTTEPLMNLEEDSTMEVRFLVSSRVSQVETEFWCDLMRLKLES